METPDQNQDVRLPPAEVAKDSVVNMRMSSQARRIFWRFQEPLETSVFVLPADLDPDGPREAYFQKTDDGHELHAVSQEPLTDKSLTSIAVKSSELDDWPNSFYELHYEHDDLGSEDDDDDDEQDEDAQWKCSGCGEMSPKKHEPLIVKASEKPYVTVHDYIIAVHPWLIGLRGEMEQAREELERPPLGDDMLVNAVDPRFVDLEDEQKWLAHGRRLLKDGYVFDVVKAFHVPKPKRSSEEGVEESSSKRKREE
ncbi:hypothetical protein CSOJ01_12107 [Colletotrichum sojae]|uniref:Uncharacterized protein n=1 Tax=Colletotrichum sojae TaxID=2175907 RepID=A0A8H6IWL4_9PEZI|nr:hypothetical protein CSOJ01_12107 [Colletotrichum sojae]